MAVCITSVDLVNDLLTSVEKLVRGEGLSEQMIAEIHRQYREVESKSSQFLHEVKTLWPLPH